MFRSALLSCLLFASASASAQVLPNICPPPAQWVQGGGGYMCECPDGTFLSLGQGCIVQAPQAVIQGVFFAAAAAISDNGLPSRDEYYLMSKNTVWNDNNLTFGGAVHIIRSNDNGQEARDIDYLVNCQGSKTTAVRYGNMSDFFINVNRNDVNMDEIPFYNLWWAVCIGEMEKFHGVWE
jgi:hypothetical protein